MITMIAHLRVRPENATAFEELMTYVAAMVHEHEPSVPYYEFAKSVDEPDTYVVYGGATRPIRAALSWAISRRSIASSVGSLSAWELDAVCG